MEDWVVEGVVVDWAVEVWVGDSVVEGLEVDLEAEETLEDRTDGPLVEPLTGPLTDPLTGPLTDPLTEPLAGPLTDPLAEPLDGPLVEPLDGPLTDPLTDPLAEPLAEPLTDPLPVLDRFPIGFPIGFPITASSSAASPGRQSEPKTPFIRAKGFPRQTTSPNTPILPRGSRSLRALSQQISPYRSQQTGFWVSKKRHFFCHS